MNGISFGKKKITVIASKRKPTKEEKRQAKMAKLKSETEYYQTVHKARKAKRVAREEHPLVRVFASKPTSRTKKRKIKGFGRGSGWSL